jgi:hypothetical protein
MILSSGLNTVPSNRPTSGRWSVEPSSLLAVLLLQVCCLAYCSVLKMEAIHSSKHVDLHGVITHANA